MQCLVILVAAAASDCLEIPHNSRDILQWEGVGGWEGLQVGEKIGYLLCSCFCFCFVILTETKIIATVKGEKINTLTQNNK